MKYHRDACKITRAPTTCVRGGPCSVPAPRHGLHGPDSRRSVVGSAGDVDPLIRRHLANTGHVGGSWRRGPCPKDGARWSCPLSRQTPGAEDQIPGTEELPPHAPSGTAGPVPNRVAPAGHLGVPSAPSRGSIWRIDACIARFGRLGPPRPHPSRPLRSSAPSSQRGGVAPEAVSPGDRRRARNRPHPPSAGPLSLESPRFASCYGVGCLPIAPRDPRAPGPSGGPQGPWHQDRARGRGSA